MTKTKTVQAVIEQATEELRKIETDKQTELAKRSEQIDSLENRRAYLSTQMENAMRDGDTAAYIKAKRERAECDDEIEVIRKRVEVIGSGCLVTNEVYTEFVRKLHAALDDETAKATAAAAVHLQEVVKIADALDVLVLKANSIISSWGNVTNMNRAPRGSVLTRTSFYNKNVLTRWVVNDIIHSADAGEIMSGESGKNWHSDERRPKSVNWDTNKARPAAVPTPETEEETATEPTESGAANE